MHFLFFAGLTAPILVILFLPGLAHLDELLGFTPLPWNFLFLASGILLAVPGLYLMAVTNLVLRASGSGANAFRLTKRIVAGDIYKRTRNPMSLGFYLLALALAFIAGSTSSTLFALLGLIPAHLFFLRYFEEFELALRFGESYLKYKRSTPFLIPDFIPPGKRLRSLSAGVRGAAHSESTPPVISPTRDVTARCRAFTEGHPPMSTLDKAVETQLHNIHKKTGKSLAQLAAVVRRSGLSKHGEIRAYLQAELGLGYGDANALVHAVLQSDGTRTASGKGQADLLGEMYSGPKAALRPIHDKLMTEILKYGEFESLPKKNYFSLRRKKQFAMIGPATNTRVEVGLNTGSLKKSPRLLEQPRGSMCNYVVRVTDPAEVDRELFTWIKAAFESAG
jgi:protein-S-isoprenylcysteine O-methyltransferase Ste14